MATGARLRVKLKSYDHRVLDNTCDSLLDTALRTGAKIVGPIPLPTAKKIITILTSPHGDKNARDHFQVLTHKRLIDIYNTSLRTVDSLQHLDLPSGVEIEIKM